MLKSRHVLAAIAVVAAMAGCATVGSSTTGSTDVDSGQTSSPTTPATPGADGTPEPIVSATPERTIPPSVESMIAFRRATELSCRRANAEGAVETDESGRVRNVLFPKKMAFHDFRAVSSVAGELSLIWSTDEFVACTVSVNFDMAETSGVTYDIAVDEITPSVFETTQQLDGGDVHVVRYHVVGGVIDRVELGTGANAVTMSVHYGTPSALDTEMLHSAVEQFLAE